jgi:hypothetical protein
MQDPHSKVHQLLQTRQFKVLKEGEDTKPKVFFLT